MFYQMVRFVLTNQCEDSYRISAGIAGLCWCIKPQLRQRMTSPETAGHANLSTYGDSFAKFTGVPEALPAETWIP